MSAAQRPVPTRREKQARTREELIEAASNLFRRDGFHATTLDRIAEEAGYTKGAVYSNFESKEDLFFAVYERRAEWVEGELRKAFSGVDPVDGLNRAVAAADAGRMRKDGWMPTFFEFWAHVLRHPEHRARFVEIHGRVVEPMVEPLAELLSRPGAPDWDPRQVALAAYSMQLGVQLELLTGTSKLDRRLHAQVLNRSINLDEEG